MSAGVSILDVAIGGLARNRSSGRSSRARPQAEQVRGNVRCGGLATRDDDLAALDALTAVRRADRRPMSFEAGATLADRMRVHAGRQPPPVRPPDAGDGRRLGARRPGARDLRGLGGRTARLGRPASAARRAVPDRADGPGTGAGAVLPVPRRRRAAGPGLAGVRRCSPLMSTSCRRRAGDRAADQRVGRLDRAARRSLRGCRPDRASPVRLLEPGASAGLNLLVDRYRFEEDGWSYGPDPTRRFTGGRFDGPVVPADFTVVAPARLRPVPVDPRTEEGALRLRSFVWPFQLERHERLVAGARPRQRIRSRSIAEPPQWLAHRLADPPAVECPHGRLAVGHPPVLAARRGQAVRDVIDDAAGRMPLGWVSMEYPSMTAQTAVVTLSGLRPDGAWSRDEVLLGIVGDHGIPMSPGRAPDG